MEACRQEGRSPVRVRRCVGVCMGDGQEEAGTWLWICALDRGVGEWFHPIVSRVGMPPELPRGPGYPRMRASARACVCVYVCV